MRRPSIGGSTGSIPIRRAVIAVPAVRDADHWVKECKTYCDEQGMPIAATLIGKSWGAALDMVTTGRAEIIVVAQESHLDPDRVPQLLVVESEREKRKRERRRLRRPRIIDR